MGFPPREYPVPLLGPYLRVTHVVYSGDEDFFEGSEFSQTESDRHAPEPSESGWGTHSAPDVRHPEEKLAKAIERKLSMRPLRAASALYADRATALIKNIELLGLTHSFLLSLHREKYHLT